ncbi:UDP-2,3-diacylglucosamine diphosphatase LpxI [Tistrella bauzanensis]
MVSGDTLGVIAGNGRLPELVIQAARDAGRAVFVVVLDGTENPARFADLPHAVIRIGAAGRIIAALKQAGVGDLVLAGGIKRPSFSTVMPDARGARLLARVATRIGQGDDALLKAVITDLETEGFRVVGADQVVDGLNAPPGIWGRVQADDHARADIRRGIEVLEALGRLDIGQAVVVQQGVVLGVEAIEGTAALIARAGDLARPGARPVLVKTAKPGQERRVDWPTIGSETIDQLARAGFAGLAVGAGRVLVIDRPALIAAADRGGLFIMGAT